MKKEKITNFSDFIYYYKWHVIIAIVIIALAVIFIRDCANKVEDDMSIALILSNYTVADTSDAISSDLENAGLVPDLDGDGVGQIYTRVITSPIDGGEDAVTASYQITIAFLEKNTVMYLIDEDLLEMYEEQGIFDDVTERAKNLDVSEDGLYVSEEGVPIGISLKGNKYLQEKGVVTDTLYACFRAGSDDADIKTLSEAADKIFEYMLSKGNDDGK